MIEMKSIIELVKLTSVGLIAGLFASYRAKKDFISQRWWERKAQAYSNIVEALWQLVDSNKHDYDALIMGAHLSDQRKTDIQAQWAKGSNEIKRSAGIGAFIISDEAAKALKEYFEKSDNIDPDNWVAQIESDYDALRVCLEKIKIAAKQDLNIA